MGELSHLRPGDVMFARHVRPLSADLLIKWGQLLLGEPGYPHHVAVVTTVGDRMRPYPRIVQAMPSGAEEIRLGPQHLGPDYVYLRPAYRVAATDYGGMAECVAAAARAYVGTPYSFADYVAIAGWHFGVKNGPIRRYVTSSKHMICSQLADQALSDAGFHVFDDGRLPQDVTPSALYLALLAMPGTIAL